MAQIAVVISLAAVTAAIAGRLEFISPMNAIWWVALPLVVGSFANEGWLRAVMSVLLVVCSWIAAGVTGTLLGGKASGLGT
jgi:VIT1/CCC1 family predicted Fe2+/Mn2+ transporter